MSSVSPSTPLDAELPISRRTARWAIRTGKRPEIRRNLTDEQLRKLELLEARMAAEATAS